MSVQLFEGFETNLIELLVNHGQLPKKSYQPKSRDTLVERLEQEVVELGIRSFVDLLSKNLLEDFTQNIEEDFMKKNGNNPRSKVVMQKRLWEKMNEVGIMSFLDTYDVDQEVLADALEILDTSVSGRDSVEELRNCLQGEIHTLGTYSFFAHFTEAFLQKVGEDYLGLSLETQSKRIMIECIVAGINWEQEELVQEKVSWRVRTGKEKKLYFDMTKAEISYFTVDEIKIELEKHDQDIVGKKMVLVNRLHEFYQDNKENWVDGNTRTKEKRSVEKPKSNKRSSSSRSRESLSDNFEDSSFESYSSEEESIEDYPADKRVSKRDLRKRVYCISGKFDYSKKKYSKWLDFFNADFGSSISDEVTHLVVGSDPNPDKIDFAKEEGITILSSDHLRAIKKLYLNYN
eukprot:TRINITY_DN7511_c0_g1_i1.p1 TRINITY_DN7511_c0_g1~~TRINITY_DN7511_c0_g1_i1.p1  ORF type:complete len:410 (-),score=125.49 TRINITY_DN7511_c0_g1_i1:56-1264(-)